MVPIVVWILQVSHTNRVHETRKFANVDREEIEKIHFAEHHAGKLNLSDRARVGDEGAEHFVCNRQTSWVGE